MPGGEVREAPRPIPSALNPVGFRIEGLGFLGTP